VGAKCGGCAFSEAGSQTRAGVPASVHGARRRLQNFDRSRSMMQVCPRMQPAMQPTPAPCSGVEGLRVAPAFLL
jgi:hypothetical protein